jgi:hypothetical protein
MVGAKVRGFSSGGGMAMRVAGGLSVPVRSVGSTPDGVVPVIRGSKRRGEWVPVGVGRLDQSSVSRNAATIVMAAPIHLADKEVDDFITSPYLLIVYFGHPITKMLTKVKNPQVPRA